MLTTPPGTSEVAIASASSIAASGCVSDATTHDRVAADERRREPGDEAAERRLVGREDRDDAGRLGEGEVEVRPGDRVRGADHLRELVRPARVPDDAVDRGLDLLLARADRGEVAGARLHHLREPVEHLAAVVGGRARPARLRLARRDDGVARVLARGAGDVLALGLVRAARLRAREGAADEELVRLPDGQPGHRALPKRRSPSTRATTPPSRSSGRRKRLMPSPRRRRRGTARARGGRPRGRSPTPCSRRTATRDRSG